MTNDDREILALLSFLLQYPDSDFRRRLRDIECSSVVRESAGKNQGVVAFLDYLKSRSPIELQESYTAVFDLNPATTLNVTYHQWKDGEKRAAALSKLECVYRHAGFERISCELPDYLPLMLEFLSVSPGADGVGWIWACLKSIGVYVGRLQAAAPAYAGLLGPLVHMVEARACVSPGDFHR